jgi:hypothetical protein
MQQLELTGTSAASSGSATIISAASPAVRAGNHLSADLGLALVVGLVAGLLLASVAETLRPRLAGARSLGRELGVGLIGTLPAAARHRSRRAGASDPSQLPAPAPEVTLPPEVVLALTTAAARAGVDEVLLVGPAGHPSAQATAAHRRDALSRRPPAGPPARAGGPVEGPVNGTPLPRLPFEHPAPGHDGPREPVPTATLVAGPVRARRAGTGPVSGRALGVHAIDDHAPVGTGRPGLLAVVPPRAPHALADRVRDLAATTGWPVIGVLGVAAPSRRDRRAGLPGEE